MKAISNFDNVKAAGSQIENLPAGGYVCEIKKCAEEPNRSGNGSHLTIQFDVAEGECAGWFANDWKAQDREEKFWHGVINQNVPDESSPKYDMQCRFFKSFINAVEESNPGYHWDWNETGLKGKRIGVIIGEAEKRSAKGTVYIITRAESVCTVDAVHKGSFKVPELKKLSGSTAPSAPASEYGLSDELPF